MIKAGYKFKAMGKEWEVTDPANMDGVWICKSDKESLWLGENTVLALEPVEDVIWEGCSESGDDYQVTSAGTILYKREPWGGSACAMAIAKAFADYVKEHP